MGDVDCTHMPCGECGGECNQAGIGESRGGGQVWRTDELETIKRPLVLESFAPRYRDK